MKTLLSFILLTLTFSATSQTTLKDLSKKKVAWMGVDFSQGKFLGKEGFRDLQKIKDYYFDEWNNATAAKKDWIMENMKLKEMSLFLDPVMTANSGIKITEYVQDVPHRIKEEDVKAAIAAYDLEACEAEVGVSFMVEYFSKTLESASIYVAFTEVSTKEVFFLKRLDSKAGGIEIGRAHV